MTIRETIKSIEQALQAIYEPVEATSIAREVVQRISGYNFSQLVVNYDSQYEIADLQQIVEKLMAGCPVQYVTGVAEFCDLDFEVCQGVLIPRPETAELVKIVAENSLGNKRILDVGTGSGAIAVSLAKTLKDSRVVAVDISDIALEVAARNATRNGVEVEFVKVDALGDMSSLGLFDIIVSNPPYIPNSDRESMHVNVVGYEPHTALFVADNDALCFYRSIAQNALQMLKKGGTLYFEIYELFGHDIAQMLSQMGFRDIEVVKDMFGKERMVWCKR